VILQLQNSAMNPSPTADSRLTDLEIKASFTEDLLEKLDAIIVRQQQQIDSLTREVAHLKQMASTGDTDEFRSLRDGPPPHY
jgi:SlyX protein